MGQTLTFTYNRGKQGMADGTLCLAVPTGWSAPSLNATDAGSVISTFGTASVSNRGGNAVQDSVERAAQLRDRFTQIKCTRSIASIDPDLAAFEARLDRFR